MASNNWSYFPVFLRLRGQPVLLVGGGEVAARKLRLLLRAAAAVQIVARELNDEVQAAIDSGMAQHLAVEFSAALLARPRLVVAATDDVVLNASRSEEHTSELQSLMRISYAVFCLKKQTKTQKHNT